MARLFEAVFFARPKWVVDYLAVQYWPINLNRTSHEKVNKHLNQINGTQKLLPMLLIIASTLFANAAPPLQAPPSSQQQPSDEMTNRDVLRKIDSLSIR